jgi:hypothetical protein
MANLIPEEPRHLGNPDDFESQLREYIKIKNSMEIFEARQKELREKLFGVLDSDGLEDEKGNLQYDLETAIDGVVRIEKQRRSSRKLDELRAEEIIEQAGIADDVYEMKRVINEDSLMAAYYQDKITEEQLDTMFPVTVTWALRTLKK